MPAPQIDREKLRAFVRKLDKGDHLLLLDRAIDVLPKSRLAELVEDYVNLEDLKPEAPSDRSLTTQVKAFYDASMRGDYYESFDVNSRNCMEMSGGTDRFVVDCDRMLRLCVTHSKKGNHAEAAAAFELIFAILRHIDKGREDVVFFADEAGSWQIGVDWDKSLPAWFESLAATASPDDFAAKVILEVDHHVRYHRDRYFKIARKAATAAQRDALTKRINKKG